MMPQYIGIMAGITACVVIFSDVYPLVHDVINSEQVHNTYLDFSL